MYFAVRGGRHHKLSHLLRIEHVQLEGGPIRLFQKAIWMLEEAKVTLEDLLSLTLEDAAQLLLEHLG